MAYFINNFLKFVFLLTPFFVLSMFLSMTQGWAMRQKRLLALRIRDRRILHVHDSALFREMDFRGV